MKKLKILVIGGGGYIGSMLTTELIKNKFYVRCFDRFSSSKTLSKLKLNKNIEIVIGDIEIEQIKMKAITGKELKKKLENYGS